MGMQNEKDEADRRVRQDGSTAVAGMVRNLAVLRGDVLNLNERTPVDTLVLYHLTRAMEHLTDIVPPVGELEGDSPTGFVITSTPEEQ